MGNDIIVPVDSFAELIGVIGMIDRLEIFDDFCQLVPWCRRGDCLRIPSNIRLTKIINNIGECSGIANSGVDD